MEFIITGGAGFIGANLVKKLLEMHVDNSNLRIDVLDCLTYSSNVKNLPLKDDRIRLLKVDISNSEALSAYVQKDYSFTNPTIFHLAAESHVDRSIADGTSFITTNIHGTFNMLKVANNINIKCFVHVSTDEVYGSVEDASSDESYPLNPTSYYSSSKAASDLIALSSYKTLGLPVVVTRCVNNFGEGQHPEKFLPRMIERSGRGQSLPIYGDGSNVREWIYVQDHVSALISVARKDFAGEIFNIGSGLQFTNLEIANLLLDLSNSTSKIEFISDRLAHDHRYSLDCSKIQAKTTWRVHESEKKFKNYLSESLVASASGLFVEPKIFELSEDFYRGE